MTKKHREILGRLDSVGLRRYQITEKEVRIVEKYLSIIQEDLKGISAWDDLIGYGGSYGTSILIHEVVELRDLQLFLESEVGVYIMEEERVEAARQALARLKGEAG